MYIYYTSYTLYSNSGKRTAYSGKAYVFFFPSQNGALINHRIIPANIR